MSWGGSHGVVLVFDRLALYRRESWAVARVAMLDSGKIKRYDAIVKLA
jgi:hypothetical protein